jgi:hypothetical protein
MEIKLELLVDFWKQDVKNKTKYQIQCACCSSSPWQLQNHDNIKTHKTHKTNFPRGSKSETQSSRFLLNSIFFGDFPSFLFLYQNSTRKSLGNGNLFLFVSRDSEEIFPPKKVRCKFFVRIPFWLHKILLSGLLKNYKETRDGKRWKKINDKRWKFLCVDKFRLSLSFIINVNLSTLRDSD